MRTLFPPPVMTIAERVMFDNVRSHLTDDLRDSEYIKMNRGKYCGHCHAASEAFFYLMGGKDAGYLVKQAKDDAGISHWWVERSGLIIDPTHEQYTDYGLVPPYAKGKTRCPNQQGYIPTNRAKKLIQRITGREWKTDIISIGSIMNG